MATTAEILTNLQARVEALEAAWDSMMKPDATVLGDEEEPTQESLTELYEGKT